MHTQLVSATCPARWPTKHTWNSAAEQRSRQGVEFHTESGATIGVNSSGEPASRMSQTAQQPWCHVTVVSGYTPQARVRTTLSAWQWNYMKSSTSLIPLISHSGRNMAPQLSWVLVCVHQCLLCGVGHGAGQQSLTQTSCNSKTQGEKRKILSIRHREKYSQREN